MIELAQVNVKFTINFGHCPVGKDPHISKLWIECSGEITHEPEGDNDA